VTAFLLSDMVVQSNMSLKDLSFWSLNVSDLLRQELRNKFAKIVPNLGLVLGLIDLQLTY